MYTFISNSENDTMKLANEFAKELTTGDVIVLSGELGSGKTKFTEGFLLFLGLEEEISSPTFTIVNEYRKNDTNIYHFDVYRLSSIDEFYAIGGEQYFDNGICIIEWGEIIKDALPSSYIHLSFKRDLINENKRIINIEAVGNKYTNLIRKVYERSLQ